MGPRFLESLGHEVVIADPNYTLMYATRSRRVKTDQRDVAALADACRLGIYRPAHRRSPAHRRLRRQLKIREHVVRLRTKTAPDLARFLAFHRNEGRIGGQSWIRLALLREVYTPQFSAREQPTGYGLAMYKAIEHDTVRFSHGGVGFGISAHYRWLPEHDFGVVVLTNQDAAHNAPAIAGDAVALMLGIDTHSRSPRRRTDDAARPSAEAQPPASSRSPRAFAGSYLLYEGLLETFEADDHHLYHVRDRQRLMLRAEGADVFSGDGRRYTFVSDAAGRVQGVRIVDPGTT